MSRKTIKKAEREKVYLKYNGHCAYCGKNIAYNDMQVDHLVPVNGWNEKGTNDFDNLMPACRRCNHYKRANSLEGWRRMIEEIPQKLERDSYIYRVALDYGLIKPKPHKIRFYYERQVSRNDIRRGEKDKEQWASRPSQHQRITGVNRYCDRKTDSEETK